MEIPCYSFIKPYDQPIERECYNILFNPNICHVCKKRLGTFKFIKVCKCSMIFYCCDEHKEIHQKQHQDLCDAIIEVNVHKVLWDTCSRNIVEWIDRKNRLLELVQAKLQRKLKLYERQIFYFIKSCFICYGRPERNGNFCTICYCINYCNAHENALHAHKYFCSRLELSLSLDLGITQNFEYPKMNFIIDFPNPYKHLCDMIEFVKQYALQPGQDTWFIDEFILTDYTTNPLTVFYGITEMQLMDHSSKKTKPFIIHVIDAKVMDTYNLPAWELLMHLFNTSLIVQ
ncbi:uncharacterized protein LOC116843050 [Odontomachus brunneus]|uniref:uncharacterized protein LOC116843050 n=1 Tax=Odontomachus brunneus TaxID=486640 RepID=UPI0013F2958C|nr:uncharacterized protein LOC116843050 [Odontomachus brunneus]